MVNTSHHRPEDPSYNNPLANRFDHLPAKKAGEFPRIAYVLQGGGALGAYQMGVVKELLADGYEPDWIAATSIGAIQAAIIVGNAPEDRVAKLQQFWHKVATYTPLDCFAQSTLTFQGYNQMACGLALTIGQRGFFNPRWCWPQWPLPATPANLSYYDTTPLRQTLLELIDFDRLNASPTRLSLGAVQVSTGHLIYFNNIHYVIGPEHIMASAALPPGFPAIEINGEYYWDGGVHSNSPLEVILDAEPEADTLCFAIDCFGGYPFLPTTMAEVEERSKDITYSTHAERFAKHYVDRQNLQRQLQQLAAHLSPKQKKACGDLLDFDPPNHCTLVHIAYSSHFHRGANKDYNFGQEILQKRIEAGVQDAQAVLLEKKKWGTLPENNQSRMYEAPNNQARLFRKS